jgi:rhamnose utilization protein RhaD (predicted bifunctional aldolase and dehydrogenase)/NAD(P)-dependent dehydrogenase (short-subunit alcohol dehydrogenase family)
LKSLWSETDARAAVARYADEGVAEDLALRTYSARLLGADPRLVLHGGGNTSVKSTAKDLFGDAVEVLCVKGSGWDLASIEPAGHPAVRLAPLRRLRELDRLSDEAMVNAQRQNLLDSAAPTPSVETLLHAFLPATFIDHTHATAVLALADQPDALRVLEQVYGADVAIVPYVMPGFELAKQAAAAFEARPGARGMILVNHGVFAFGESAREAYETMIELVSQAEGRIPRRAAAPASPTLEAGAVLPALRGLLAQAAGEAWPGRWLLDLRQGPEAMELAARADVFELAERGVATPDHVIRTKRAPLVLAAPGGDIDAWREDASGRLAAFIAAYQAYFARHVVRYPEGRKALDPLPRLVVIPGVGLAGLGRNAADAAVAADIGESWAWTVLAAEAAGRYAPIGEADTFDMEYWSLEQAKLKSAAPKALEGQVVVITGAAGAIGAATARAFAAAGAEVALLDIDVEGARAAAARAGRRALALACDVTRPDDIGRALGEVTRRFGGLDIVVSNAGAAIGGDMATLGEAELRRSFDINLFAHQSLAQGALRILAAQGTGGVLLFNVSKQALNPGPGLGAYGAAKAALLALVRQYALEHGADGVRANAVNADRIRSGLLTPQMIAQRSAARGVDEATYMAGNLLRREVTAEDVAQAFVFAAQMRSTTGAILTVDGGNVAAMVR